MSTEASTPIANIENDFNFGYSKDKISDTSATKYEKIAPGTKFQDKSEVECYGNPHYFMMKDVKQPANAQQKTPVPESIRYALKYMTAERRAKYLTMPAPRV